MEYTFLIRHNCNALNTELNLRIKVVRSKQEYLEHISAALCGLKDMKRETAMNCPSQTEMHKEIMGQSGIDISKYRKDFQFGNHFHTTHCSKCKNLTSSMLSSNLKSLKNHSFFLQHKSNDEDVKSGIQNLTGTVRLMEKSKDEQKKALKSTLG